MSNSVSKARTWTWDKTCYLFAEIFDCILLELESGAFSRSLFNEQFMLINFLVTKYMQSLCFQMIEELPYWNAFFFSCKEIIKMIKKLMSYFMLKLVRMLFARYQLELFNFDVRMYLCMSTIKVTVLLRYKCRIDHAVLFW